MTRAHTTRERGIALVITLMITALLVVVITEIVYSVHLHLTMTALFAEGQDAGLLAQGGVELASSGIREMTEPSYTYLGENESQVLPIGDNVLSLHIVDEQGKVGVNYVVYKNGKTNDKFYAIYTRLLDGLDMDVELADTLADWIDRDDELRTQGAEGHDYYSSLKFPYESKGAPLGSAGEMTLVKGYTPVVMKRLVPFVSVYSDGLININTAPKEVLMALSEDMTEDLADAVIKYRADEPFKTKADIRKVQGLDTIGFDLQAVITVKSDIFRIFSSARVGDARREVEAVVDLKGAGKKLFWRER